MVSEHIGYPNFSLVAISSLLLFLPRLITVVANVEYLNATHSLLNIYMVNITKLNSTNFMTCSLKIYALLDGYYLAGYIDESLSAPEHTHTFDKKTTPNPDYTNWRHQDHLIYSGLIETLSPSIQISHDVWKSLSTTFATPSWGHIQQLRFQLNHYTKADKTIDDYMRNFTSRFNQLALLGKPLDHEEKIHHWWTLWGLQICGWANLGSWYLTFYCWDSRETHQQRSKVADNVCSCFKLCFGHYKT